MKSVVVAWLIFLSFAPAEDRSLSEFELTDQNAQTRHYQFPKEKITVMTVADHKGSDQLTPWIQCLYDRYGKTIDIDGIADVSMIPTPFQNFFRNEFRKKLTRSVMLDWGGSVVRQFGYEKGIANIYVIDRGGRIVKQRSGAVSDTALKDMAAGIDQAIKNP